MSRFGVRTARSPLPGPRTVTRYGGPPLGSPRSGSRRVTRSLAGCGTGPSSTSRTRRWCISALPDLPTLKEAGFPEADFPFWIGVFAPSQTPKDIQDKLYRETTKALRIKTVQDKLIALGGEPFEMTSSEFDGFFRAQIKANRELVKAAGIKPI